MRVALRPPRAPGSGLGTTRGDSTRWRRGGSAAHAAIRRLLLGAVVVVASLWFASSAAAQTAMRTPATDAVAQKAIEQLRSPYCPGLMLETCPSGQAELLRDSIRALAAEGNSASDLIEWMLARHGEEWRAVPKRSGIGLWAWIIPPLVLLLGLGAVVAKLRSMRAPAGSIGTGASPERLSHNERDELAAALREWERFPEGKA